MNKKHLIYTFATCIFVALVAVFFTSCKDNNEEEAPFVTWCPENMNYDPFFIEKEAGYFMQNRNTGEWEFHLDDHQVLGENFGDCSGAEIIVTNMPENLKDINSKVRVSGKIQFLHLKRSTASNAETILYIYNLEVTDAQKLM